jgi:hypothetical protein
VATVPKIILDDRLLIEELLVGIDEAGESCPSATRASTS